jgi:hypothetical protein
MRIPAVVVVVAACSGGSKSPPASPPPPPPTASLLDCDRVADHVATTVDADRPRPYATHAAVKDLVATRCQTDAWTDETKRCLYAIKTITAGRACASTMADEQRTAIREAARALRQGAAPPDADDNSGDWIKHVVEEPAKQTR